MLERVNNAEVMVRALLCFALALLLALSLANCSGEESGNADFEFRNCGDGTVDPDEACDQGDGNVQSEEECPVGQTCCVSCDRTVVGG